MVSNTAFASDPPAFILIAASIPQIAGSKGTQPFSFSGRCKRRIRSFEFRNLTDSRSSRAISFDADYTRVTILVYSLDFN